MNRFASRVPGWDVLVLLACILLVVPAGAARADAPAKEAQVTIRIYDQDGKSVLVEAKKKVPGGQDAFDVLRGIVRVEFKTFPKLGPFVTGLASLSAPDGSFWELTVDGAVSQVGIGDIKITKDIEIVWKLKKIEK